MRILISNDDGYKAEGILQLAKSLNDIAEVIVVAPSKNKSAASSSLTIGKPLKPIQIEKNIYAIDATPSDCVHLALCGFIKESVDLVVTGINFGANLIYPLENSNFIMMFEGGLQDFAKDYRITYQNISGGIHIPNNDKFFNFL